MTICIAAICDNNNAAVVATDRMVSANFLALEFEHPDAKIDELAKTCVGLSAGDALATTELWGGTKGRIQTFKSPSINAVAEFAKDQFVEIRQKRAEALVLKPRGIGFDDFYQQGIIQRLPPDLAMQLDNNIQRCEVPVTAIIAGIDSTGAHIYGITDPGIATCYDRLSYHAIGSGEIHALLHIIGANHQRTNSVNHTVFAVYEAKRHAELAQGVGKDTDMMVITKGKIRKITLEEQEQLDSIYKKKIAPQMDEMDAAIQKLSYT